MKLEYAATLMERFSKTSKEVKAIESSSRKKIPLEDEMFANRMSIKQLMETDWNPDLEIR